MELHGEQDWCTLMRLNVYSTQHSPLDAIMNGCPCDDASGTYFLSPSHNTKQYFRYEGRYVGNMCVVSG